MELIQIKNNIMYYKDIKGRELEFIRNNTPTSQLLLYQVLSDKVSDMIISDPDNEYQDDVMYLIYAANELLQIFSLANTKNTKLDIVNLIIKPSPLAPDLSIKVSIPTNTKEFDYWIKLSK